ncbi:hypothetical protein IFR05_014921 [Cadophora sp. M221]|nr:hypothetical protein IFR05_014921 [Cadophora sp. M221]
MSAIQALELLPVAEMPFPRFASVPAEIRQMIWRTAAVPRIVGLQYVEGTKHTCSRVWAGTSIDGPEMMGFFDLDNQSPMARFDQGPEAFARFDSKALLPELFLEEDGDEELPFQFLPLDLSEDVKKVNNLAVYQGELPHGLQVNDYMDMNMKRFGNVENLTIVPPNSDREMSGLVFLELSECREYPEYNDDETFG